MAKIYISAFLAINPKFVLEKENKIHTKSCLLKRKKIIFMGYE